MLPAVFLFACVSEEKALLLNDNPAILEDVLINNYEDGLVPVADIDTHPLIQQHFDWYTHLLSPSGTPVVILAQNPLSRAQIIRLRTLLKFYLTPRELVGLPDIGQVFDTMGDNQSSLLFFTDGASRELAYADGLLELDWVTFSLLGEENIVEGSDDWINGVPPDDAFHLCYEMVFRSGVKEASPEVFERIGLLADTALDGGIWTPSDSEMEQWNSEERASAFISQLLSIDFGYWTNSDSPFDASWTVNSRSQIEMNFPSGANELRSLFPLYYDETIYVDPRFSSSFVLDYSSEIPWSGKSQYFVNVTLDGDHDIDLAGNAMDNFLSGNAGSNRITGGDGIDTVALSGPRSEYEIQQTANGILLFDDDATRDGTDEIIDVEWMEFSDGTVSFDELSNR